MIQSMSDMLFWLLDLMNKVGKSIGHVVALPFVTIGTAANHAWL